MNRGDRLQKNFATASLALTVFWATGTGGRLLFTSINLWIRELKMPCPLFPDGDQFTEYRKFDTPAKQPSSHQSMMIHQILQNQ